MFCPQYQKTSCGNPFLFPKFFVSKLFLDKKCGGYQNSPSKIFCPTVPKNIVGESFCVSELFCYGIIVWIRGLGGAGVSQFSVRNFLWNSGEKGS